MVHIGSPTYYQELQKRLANCDAIVYEGVHSLRGRILTLSYAIVARRKRLGLATQRTALLLSQFHAKLIHADVTAEELSRDWVRMPWALARSNLHRRAAVRGISLFHCDAT